jgi:diguanylate cyclase (GGDEF)-like protein
VAICNRFFNVATKLLIIAIGLISFVTFAKEAWVDEAVAFAEKLKDTHNPNSSRTLDEIEQGLLKLTPLKRLEAYQQLAFIKLVDFRIAEYQALKNLYSPVLQQYGDDNGRDMQLVLDILEATVSPENRDEAIVTVESLIEGVFLSEESHILAHVVHVYSRNFKRNTPNTLNAMRHARNAYALSKKPKFAGLALELVSAYTSLNVQDYAQSNKRYRTAYENIKEFGHLYFNVDNYLSNLSWMLRQTNELQHAIDINNWQLESLSQDSNKNYAFFVYFACGVYEQVNRDFERSLDCFFSAEKLIEYAPERWGSWHAGTIISLVMADRIERAKQYYSEFINDPRSKNELGPLSKIRLAKAYLDIEEGESKEAIEALNTYHVNNANRQTTSFRKLSMEYNTFIDSEIKALEKNVSLQKRLLRQQTVLNGFGIAIIIGLIIFTVFLLKNRKKQHILATHDSLTGMYNRRGFLEVFPKILDKAKREGSTLALGVVDIDRFKAINEVNGHAVGDEVLNTTAMRLKEMLGKDVVAGRMGGDEFAFILTNKKDKAAVMKIGVALCDSLSNDIQISNVSLKPSVSIGFSTYPDTASNTQQLVDCADFALYSCKQFERGGARLFSPCDQSSLEERRNIEAALANAKEDEFTLYYQPIVDARTEQVKGFEALARWQSTELGFVSPADFIPVAERTGYINKLSRWLLTKALE